MSQDNIIPLLSSPILLFCASFRLRASWKAIWSSGWEICALWRIIEMSLILRKVSLFSFILEWNIDKTIKLLGVQEVDSSLYIQRNDVVNDVRACRVTFNRCLKNPNYSDRWNGIGMGLEERMPFRRSFRRSSLNLTALTLFNIHRHSRYKMFIRLANSPHWLAIKGG